MGEGDRGGRGAEVRLEVVEVEQVDDAVAIARSWRQHVVGTSEVLLEEVEVDQIYHAVVVEVAGEARRDVVDRESDFVFRRRTRDRRARARLGDANVR